MHFRRNMSNRWAGFLLQWWKREQRKWACNQELPDLFLFCPVFCCYSNSDELTLLSNSVNTSWRCKHQWPHLCEAAKRCKKMMPSLLLGYRNLDFEVCKNQSRCSNKCLISRVAFPAWFCQLALLGAARCLGRWRLKVVYRPHDPKRRCFDFFGATLQNRNLLFGHPSTWKRTSSGQIWFGAFICIKAWRNWLRLGAGISARRWEAQRFRHYKEIQKGFALTDLTRLGGNVSKHIKISSLWEPTERCLARPWQLWALHCALRFPIHWNLKVSSARVIIWHSFCGTADLL